jgi:hypothetical protein
MQTQKIKKNITEGFDKKKNKTWKNIGKQSKPSKKNTMDLFQNST